MHTFHSDHGFPESTTSIEHSMAITLLGGGGEWTSC